MGLGGEKVETGEACVEGDDGEVGEKGGGDRLIGGSGGDVEESVFDSDVEGRSD